MLNKENYVPWSSHLLCYAKSRPSEKLIYNSIMNGPYVRRMIPEPGDPNHEVPVPETFHEQTDDELIEAETKQTKVDDQAIQTILLGLPKNIYAAVDSCETAQEIWFTSTKGESIESYYHHFLKLMNDFKRNKHFPEKIADYTQLYDFLKYIQREMVEGNEEGNHFRQYARQNVGNQGVQNVVQNLSVQNVRNQNRIIVVLGIANHKGNGNVVAARTEGNAITNNGNQEEAKIQLQAEELDLMAASAGLDEIEEVNANYILMANLQQLSTSGTHSDKALIYDSNRSAEYTKLLEPIPKPHQEQQNDSNVTSAVSSVEQGGGTVEKHPIIVEEKRVLYDSLYNILATKVEKFNSVNHSFYHFEHKMALGYQDPSYLKQAQQKQQSLYTGKVLLEKHDPPVVYDSKETLELAHKSRLKMKQLNKEIKAANYTKINHLFAVFVSQTAKSCEELHFSNTSKTANVSKTISIPNEDFSDDTTPSVAQKFLNEIKSTIVTLQRAVKK
nr:hypothetical protein [Tanacetum cinerariifolium]